MKWLIRRRQYDQGSIVFLTAFCFSFDPQSVPQSFLQFLQLVQLIIVFFFLLVLVLAVVLLFLHHLLVLPLVALVLFSVAGLPIDHFIFGREQSVPD